ncbi:MAG TPA: dihydrodipicolinate reductase C-terminal domain-containing protein [Holophagaceae bacterium]|nr:dihydrodipicolinate reductase C-terminal domain-containing protein [Holophagaceae bacterium]HJW31817.1 dihydrodipicolinate reductase C-terminal domain-containing protein [Holophagaceae bacterium]
MTPELTIGLFGRGRLAQAIRDAAPEGVEVLWMVGRDEDPTGKVDVAIDASKGEAVAAHLDWALDSGTDLVIGATGWALADLPARVGDRIGLLTAPNFSLSVALMARLATVLGRYAQLAPELDPWLLESHHRMKADAPSGTALRLLDAFMEGCPRKTTWALNPQGPIAPHALSVGVLRAGSDPGTHVLGLDGPAETLRLEHHARSRGVFGAGAIRAAAWLKGRKGCHTFDDLAAELLDPLFHFGGSR